MPVTDLGTQREALMGNTEFYKKKVVEYLEVSRGLLPQMDSFIEGTLADRTLLKGINNIEYWLEVKATIISIGEAKFASELGEYLSSYLIRSVQNRFRMIIAVQGYRDKDYLRKVYHELDESSIRHFLEFILSVTDQKSKAVIQKFDFKDIKRFFEDTEILKAPSAQALTDAIEKRRPKPPLKPKLVDALYAAEVLNRYNSTEPLQAEDMLFSNLFQLKLPKEIWIAETPYDSESEFLRDQPELIPQPVRVTRKSAYSFFELSSNTLLGRALKTNLAKKVELENWDVTLENKNIVLYLLYKWIDNLCYERNLILDERTKRYFFFENYPRKYPKTVHWKSQRLNTREVIIPVKGEDGTIYYYSHRAVHVTIRSLWNRYFVELFPGRVFSGDCYNPHSGNISDKLDRAYRKSKFNRNKSQLNDVIFWSKILFSEQTTPIDQFVAPINGKSSVVQVLNQQTVSADKKPNAVDEEDEDESEGMEELTSSQILDSFFEETTEGE